MWQVNQDLVLQGLSSARYLLSDNGMLPIKQLILLKNLASKLIPKSNSEERKLMQDKIVKLCDTDIMEITELEIEDFTAWVTENEEMDEHFSSSTRSL